MSYNGIDANFHNTTSVSNSCSIDCQVNNIFREYPVYFRYRCNLTERNDCSRCKGIVEYLLALCHFSKHRRNACSAGKGRGSLPFLNSQTTIVVTTGIIDHTNGSEA